VGQNSLSLFETVSDEPSSSKAPVAEHRDARDQQQRHLLAARRLARGMARLPDQSPEQVRAGRMICRHLVAMLKEAEAQAATTPH
jgi:transposase